MVSTTRLPNRRLLHASIFIDAARNARGRDRVCGRSDGQASSVSADRLNDALSALWQQNREGVVVHVRAAVSTLDAAWAGAVLIPSLWDNRHNALTQPVPALCR